MRRLVYVSSATRLPDAREVADLAAEAGRRNAAAGVTGMLLYMEGMFFQLLEGEPDAVAAIYARIAADRRHAGLIVMLDEETDRRLCPDWSMGHRFIDPTEPVRFDAFRLTGDALRRRLGRDRDGLITSLSGTFLHIAGRAA